MSFAEFLKMYAVDTDRKHLSLISECRTTALHGYNQNLASVWDFDNLTNGKALLDVLSLLGPDSIPEDLLDVNSGHPWRGYFQGSLAFTEARGELLRGSLVSRDRIEKSMRIRPLVQDTVRAGMNADRFNRVYRHTLNNLAAVWPTTFSGFGNTNTDWKRCEKLWNHAIALKRHFGQFDCTIQLSEEALQGYKTILDIAWKVNDVIHYRPTILTI